MPTVRQRLILGSVSFALLLAVILALAAFHQYQVAGRRVENTREKARSALLAALRRSRAQEHAPGTHQGRCRVSFSPDGRTLATVGWFGDTKIWDPSRYRAIGEVQGQRGTGLFFESESQLLAVACDDDSIILWDLKAQKPLEPLLKGHKKPVKFLAFSPDGQVLASASEDKTIILWDLNTCQPLAPPLAGHQGAVGSLAFSPDGKILASAVVIKPSYFGT